MEGEEELRKENIPPPHNLTLTNTIIKQEVEGEEEEGTDKEESTSMTTMTGGGEGSGFFPLLAWDATRNFTFLKEEDPRKKCSFCFQSSVDQYRFGPLIQTNFDSDKVMHYFCMLTSASLTQRGKDNEGIMGFLEEDIIKEIRRAGKLKCTFCLKSGASIGCEVKRCRCTYHFPCGLENGVQYQFIGNYASFCSTHHKGQVITVPEADWTCRICSCKVTKEEQHVLASCCNRTVFHKMCLQKLAASAGYFFNCPMCKNKDDFVTEMRSHGIFVPEQDASWEREPNAFIDLYTQTEKCDVNKCACPKGRRYVGKRKYRMAKCNACGGNGHYRCGGVTDKNVDDWECESCAVVSRRIENGEYRIDFSLLKFTPFAKEHFPYSTDQLKKFYGKKGLPNWANCVIRVNMTDYLYKTVEGGQPKLKINGAGANPDETNKNETAAKDEPKPSTSSATVTSDSKKKNEKGTKMKRRKTSRWGRGEFGKTQRARARARKRRHNHGMDSASTVSTSTLISSVPTTISCYSKSDNENDDLFIPKKMMKRNNGVATSTSESPAMNGSYNPGNDQNLTVAKEVMQDMLDQLEDSDVNLLKQSSTVSMMMSNGNGF